MMKIKLRARMIAEFGNPRYGYADQNHWYVQQAVGTIGIVRNLGTVRKKQDSMGVDQWQAHQADGIAVGRPQCLRKDAVTILVQHYGG